MDRKYNQAYIKDLLARAEKADAGHKVFGAERHKYKLNPPISIDAVRQLEAEFNMKLPEDYVYFLTEIGNGGAGPYCGLYSLEKLRMYCLEYCGLQDDAREPIIDSSLTIEKWNEVAEHMEYADDAEYDKYEKYISTGILIIGTQGCTYDNLLMCKGSEAGKIVYIDWNLEPDYPPYLTGKTFMEWYVGYFEEIIAGNSVQTYGYRKRG